MINSHKELIEELKNFVSKFDLINDFKYLKDVQKIVDEMTSTTPRTFVVGLEGADLDDEGYNTVLTYNFVFTEESLYDDESVLNAETENLFCLSALGDYLNFIQDSPVEFNNIQTNVESDTETGFVSLSGSFDFIVKRSGSYWKKMEEYSI